jgi:hypothetical protein
MGNALAPAAVPTDPSDSLPFFSLREAEAKIDRHLVTRGRRGVFLLRVMKKAFDRRTFQGLLGALALAACTTESAAPADAAAVPASVRSYRYEGAAGTSDVVRETTDIGRETLRGTTELALGNRSSDRAVAREKATIDARGRLARAEIGVARSGSAETRYTLDATRGTVRIERPGAAPLDWLVPADAPWLYAPGNESSLRAADRDAHDVLVTPIGAWVALRAARAGDVVRVIEPEHQRSYLVMGDQISVETELGTTVAIGSDGIDADARFIKELRLYQGTITLARMTASDLGV